jgi:hypothetical protein
MGDGRKSSQRGLLTKNWEMDSTVRVCRLHALKLYAWS